MPDTEPSTAAQSSSALGIPPGNYVADPARSWLSFRAKAFGLVWVRGHMPAVGGTIQVAKGRLRGTGEVAASQVSTGLRARDWHLRTRRYLHTARHPNIQMSVDDADIASGHADLQVIVRETPNARDVTPDPRLPDDQPETAIALLGRLPHTDVELGNTHKGSLDDTDESKR